MSSRLDKMSIEFRKKLLAKNRYTQNKKYNISHPNALSDGDEIGMGLNNGSVGTNVDIAQREKLLAKNLFNKNNPYSIENA